MQEVWSRLTNKTIARRSLSVHQSGVAEICVKHEPDRTHMSLTYSRFVAVLGRECKSVQIANGDLFACDRSP